MVLLIVAMMMATVIEKAGHPDLAFSLVYHSPVFIAGWAAVAVMGIILLISARVCRRPAVLGIHVAFLLILAGALVTHLLSDEGKMHLRTGESSTVYFSKAGESRNLPFSLSLLDFEAVRSAGGAPIDFVSTVMADGDTVRIAMNRILKKDGYRIYQAGYDEDEQGSYLSISHDPWGTGISYAGYWCLFLSLALFFFDGKSRFREAIRRYIGKSAAGVFVGALCLFGSGQQASAAPKVLPREIADEFGHLYVNYNGRICQVQTMARDYVMKVYGKPSVQGFTAEQVFTGWLYFHDSWKDVPVKGERRGGAKVAEKQQIVLDIASGRDLKIFPVKGDSGIVWYASASKLPFDMDSQEWLFIREVNSLVGEYAFKGDWDAVKNVITKVGKYQLKSGAELPSDSMVKTERFYNAIGRPFIPAMASLTLGIIMFVLMCMGLDSSGSTAMRNVHLCCHILICIAWIYLSAVLALRWHVSGHVPLSNGYEMMLTIAWCCLLLTGLFGPRLRLLHCFGFILSGFAMLVACLGQASPQIGTLMPVLSSPLLSVHVSFMMLSYTLLGLLALNGLLGLIQGHSSETEANEAVDRGIIILYPALFFLTAGTFIGAIWANVSWGSYWAWDPKETWALITLLTYSAAVHSRSLRRFQNPTFFNAFCIVAFLCVLVTYFGVNFFLGGAHSYA